MEGNDGSHMQSPQGGKGRAELRGSVVRALIVLALSVAVPGVTAMGLGYAGWLQLAPITAAFGPFSSDPRAAVTPTATGQITGTSAPSLLGAAAPLGIQSAAQLQSTLVDASVDELLAHALAYNPDLRAVRAEADAAWGRLLQMGLSPGPWLATGAQPGVAGLDMLLAGLTRPLDLNLSRARPSVMAGLEFEMKRVQLIDKWRTLRTGVRMKAGELLAALQKLYITDELLHTNRQALALVRARVRAGAAAPLEEGMQLVEVNRLEASRRTLESRGEILKLQLRTLAGLAPEAPLSVRGALSPTPPTLSREEAVTRALTVRPDLTLARAEVAMARVAPPKEMAGGGMEPMGMMGMMGCTSNGEGRGLNAISTWGDSPSSQGLWQYATAPPPFQNLVQGKTLAAAARVQAALDRLDSMVLMIRQEVAAAFIQYDAAQHALDIYAQGVREPARQNLEIVRKAYELGRIPLLEVINEQRKYIDIEMGYAEALKEAYDAGVEIERAVGAVNL